MASYSSSMSMASYPYTVFIHHRGPDIKKGLRFSHRFLFIQDIKKGLIVESSDSKAKIQEIKPKVQDKFNYNGNCNVKIGIIPERSGTPFLKIGVLRPTPMVQKDHSTQLVLRLTGAKLISREYDITSIVSKLSTSEVIVLPRGFLTKISTSACSLSDGPTHPESTFWML